MPTLSKNTPWFTIQQLQDMLEIVIYIRENGIEKLSSKVDNIVNRLWDKIEKQDTWYESDLKVLNTILFSYGVYSSDYWKNSRTTRGL